MGDNVDGWQWEEELHRLVKLGRVMGAKEVEREKEIERKVCYDLFYTLERRGV